MLAGVCSGLSCATEEPGKLGDGKSGSKSRAPHVSAVNNLAWSSLNYKLCGEKGDLL